jgi:endoglycosylceramidase
LLRRWDCRRRLGGSPRALALLAGVTAVLLCAGAPPSVQARPAALLPLHSVSGNSPRIVDSSGRQVLLRGVNEDALGEYYQQYPQLAPVLSLTENDFREMAGLGFNVVRLVLSWSRLEPRRGRFNLQYVKAIRRAVDWARANDIYVVLDMHQDAWGIGTRGTPAETCPPSAPPPVGYDGAPEWATLTGGLPSCAVDGIREISPADETAWQNFYENTKGIQSQLVTTWGRLAAQFASDPAVAGYDLLNEPNPGLSFNETLNQLGAYYAGALAAIRAGERSVRHGFSHIAFFEPGVEWSAAGTGATPRWSFTTQPDVVFAPHLYGGSLAATSVDQGFAYAASAARTYGTTIWSGEYGWYGNPTQDEADILEFARQQDTHLWGGAWWQWKQACGSPSTIGSYGQKPPTSTNSLVQINCVTGAGAGPGLPSVRQMLIPASTGAILGRPTVHAAPGIITSLKSDPRTGSFAVSGRRAASGGSCALQAWAPGSGRPRFSGIGVRRVASARVRGGYEITACVHGTYALRLIGRARPGLGCRAALSLRSILRRRRTITLSLRESGRAESPCRGSVSLRGGGRKTFNLASGRSKRFVYRLRTAKRRRRLRVTVTGHDIDANAFRRTYSLAPRGW